MKSRHRRNVGRARIGARPMVTTLAAAALTLATASAALAWGARGHAMVGRAAAAGLPTDMPAFFRGAAGQLEYLNAEPDRWRSHDATVMDEAWKYDHYIDLENVPPGALDAPDRFRFIRKLHEAGIEKPEQDVGFLPYRILELQARVTSGFARWRAADSARERAWIEQRIINDAGILGHYVADASQPHHATIHYNGWAEDAPNPNGYTTDRDFHWRFESEFVDAHVTPGEVMAAVPAGVAPIEHVRRFVMGYIRDSNAKVDSLYELEKRYGFTTAAADAATERFVIERLATAAAALRSLWYTAWVESAEGAR